MKYFLLFLFTSILAGSLYAQSKKSSTLIGYQTGVIAPIQFSNVSLKNIKIGLPTFSYAVSLEKRFSIHNKLNFSFQYSLNYLRQNQVKRLETEYYLKNQISSSLNINSLYDIGKATKVYAGVGVSNAIASYFKDKNKISNTKNKSFGLSDFNPSLILGIENSTRIFNKNLFYSLQYNFGFFPLGQNLRIENNEQSTPIYIQGVQFGLKYKY